MRPSFAALSAICCALTACNLITGASNLEVTGGHGGSGGSGSGAGSPSSSGATSSSGSGPSSSSGSMPMCSPPCGPNQHCEDATLTCVCDPGFVKQGGMCVGAPPGDPSTHTQQAVCDAWAQGHAITDPSPFVNPTMMMCDAGSLKQAGITDTLARINMFRWMSGLGPVTSDAGHNADAQKCANLETYWDFNMGGSPHSPPSSVACYTPEGANAAGHSNIAWGSGHPAQAIDQFMEDWGNETTMGHRRWILNPPLGPVGIGYWSGGGQFGDAECLWVLDSSGGGPSPAWTSSPPAGFVPIEVAQWTWTFHGSIGGIAGATASVLRVDDNTPLTVQMLPLSQGYGQETTSWIASGWSVEAGKTYRVTLSGLAGGDVQYDVKPVVCN